MLMNAMDICFDLAFKMKEPDTVICTVNHQIRQGTLPSPEWPNISLAWGLSGMIYFYSAMDQQFPDESWDSTIHDYMLIARESAEKDESGDLSWFSGLAGYHSAIRFASKRQRYQRMLSILDELLIKEVHTVYLQQVDRYMEPARPIPPNLYNLSIGLSGLVIYLSSCEDNRDLINLAQNCLQALVRLMSELKVIGDNQVPAWFNAIEDEPITEYKRKYATGLFKFDIPNGITGVLAALSIAKLRGFDVVGLSDLINNIAVWLLEKKIPHQNQARWKHVISFNEIIENSMTQSEHSPRNWFSGAPGILRSLFLASKAVGEKSLRQFCEENLLLNLTKTTEDDPADLSFCFGKAGLLSIAHTMACDTQNPEYFSLVRKLETDIAGHYNPQHPFGFQTLHQHADGRMDWSDHPCLLNGAAGIGLTLLQTQRQQGNDWIHPFALCIAS